MKTRSALVALAIVVALLCVCVLSLPDVRGGAPEAMWRLSNGTGVVAVVGGDSRVPVYAHDEGILTRVGYALTDSRGTSLTFHPYADCQGVADHYPVARLVRANFATLWRLQSDEDKKALRQQTGAFFKAVGSELQSIRRSIVFKDNYEPELQAVISDVMAQTLQATADEELGEEAIRQVSEAVCNEVLPVVTAVAMDLAVQNAKDYARDLSFEDFVDSARETIGRLGDDEPWFSKVVSRFLTDVMADPRTLEALGRAIETCGNSRDTAAFVERTSAGFVSRLLADDRIEKLTNDLIKDPEMAPHWEALGTKAGEAFDAFARALMAHAGGERLDPFVALVFASMLYGEEGACVILCPAEDSGRLANGEFAVLRAADGGMEQ
jgi:hypothetical protein